MDLKKFENLLSSNGDVLIRETPSKICLQILIATSVVGETRLKLLMKVAKTPELGIMLLTRFPDVLADSEKEELKVKMCSYFSGAVAIIKLGGPQSERVKREILIRIAATKSPAAEELFKALFSRATEKGRRVMLKAMARKQSLSKEGFRSLILDKNELCFLAKSAYSKYFSSEQISQLDCDTAGSVLRVQFLASHTPCFFTDLDKISDQAILSLLAFTESCSSNRSMSLNQLLTIGKLKPELLFKAAQGTDLGDNSFLKTFRSSDDAKRTAEKILATKDLNLIGTFMRLPGLSGEVVEYLIPDAFRLISLSLDAEPFFRSLYQITFSNDICSLIVREALKANLNYFTPEFISHFIKDEHQLMSVALTQASMTTDPNPSGLTAFYLSAIKASKERLWPLGALETIAIGQLSYEQALAAGVSPEARQALLKQIGPETLLNVQIDEKDSQAFVEASLASRYRNIIFRKHEQGTLQLNTPQALQILLSDDQKLTKEELRTLLTRGVYDFDSNSKLLKLALGFNDEELVRRALENCPALIKDITNFENPILLTALKRANISILNLLSLQTDELDSIILDKAVIRSKNGNIVWVVENQTLAFFVPEILTELELSDHLKSELSKKAALYFAGKIHASLSLRTKEYFFDLDPVSAEELKKKQLNIEDSNLLLFLSSGIDKTIPVEISRHENSFFVSVDFKKLSNEQLSTPNKVAKIKLLAKERPRQKVVPKAFLRIQIDRLKEREIKSTLLGLWGEDRFSTRKVKSEIANAPRKWALNIFPILYSYLVSPRLNADKAWKELAEFICQISSEDSIKINLCISLPNLFKKTISDFEREKRIVLLLHVLTELAPELTGRSLLSVASGNYSVPISTSLDQHHKLVSLSFSTQRGLKIEHLISFLKMSIWLSAQLSNSRKASSIMKLVEAESRVLGISKVERVKSLNKIDSIVQLYTE